MSAGPSLLATFHPLWYFESEIATYIETKRHSEKITAVLYKVEESRPIS